jgi:formyltetrahydrofolate-dependent phosphoribosylglycinamide formyltransferase
MAMSNRVLIIGSGAREHVIAENISKSDKVNKIYLMPGNSGMNYESVSIDENNYDDIMTFCRKNNIDLVIIGPEKHLVNGLCDILQENNIKCFGPTKKAAQIEGSKIYSKSLMMNLDIPTSKFQIFNDKVSATKYLNDISNNTSDNISKYVIKLSGLAGGKGVYLPNTHEEACIIINNIFKKGNIDILIEEKVYGTEVSVLGFCNGETTKLMPQAQDYKRIFDDDLGPNTGGMGSICPVNTLNTIELLKLEKDMNKIVKHLNYTGVLYAGVMKTNDGYSILEFNCRFGDPEAQSILNLLDTDLYEICINCISGNNYKIKWKKGFVANVVLSHSTYPVSKSQCPLKMNVGSMDTNTKLYWSNNYNDTTIGGRVCSIVSYDNFTLYNALNNVYNNIYKIKYNDQFYRRDIGLKYILENGSNKEKIIDVKSNKKIKIAILGSTRGSSAQLLIDEIKNKNINAIIEVIVSDRKNALILERANKHAIPYAYLPKKRMTREEYDNKLAKLLRIYDVDIVLLVGYMRIVTSTLLNEYKNRIFNIHPSLLPYYGGGTDLNVHQQILNNNEKYTGCTLHHVTEKVDAGKLVLQRQLIINKNDDATILKTRVQELEKQVIVDFIRLCDNGQYNSCSNYSDSGVDIDKGNQFVKLIKELSTECKKEIGGFCSIVPISSTMNNDTSYDQIMLGLATDGVGTKIELADEYHIYDTIGIDLVAMSVNDLIARGVTPQYFLDYLAVDKLNLKNNYEILKGIYKGCEIAKCKLVGGETAELGSIYRLNGFDLAGFATGTVLKSNVLPRFNNITKGDKLYGIPSNGIHSNGFSLVRKIIRHKQLNNTDFPTINELLKPTRIYIKALDLMKQFPSDIVGAAHITGGGFHENLIRTLPKHLTYKVINKWKLPHIFKWIKKEGRISDSELNRTFNCGIGMVLVIKNSLELDCLRKYVEDIVYIGDVV